MLSLIQPPALQEIPPCLTHRLPRHSQSHIWGGLPVSVLPNSTKPCPTYLLPTSIGMAPSPNPQVAQKRPTNLPLSLLRHGSGLIGFGLLFGFVVPLTPYPRLGLTAHIQFAVEGTMVVAAGLVLNAKPFQRPADVKGVTPSENRVVDFLAPWQRRVVHWGMIGIWVTLLSEAANAWWGTQWVLPIAHDAAGLMGDGPAKIWMERVVATAHYPFAMLLATVVRFITTSRSMEKTDKKWWPVARYHLRLVLSNLKLNHTPSIFPIEQRAGCTSNEGITSLSSAQFSSWRTSCLGIRTGTASKYLSYWDSLDIFVYLR